MPKPRIILIQKLKVKPRKSQQKLLLLKKIRQHHLMMNQKTTTLTRKWLPIQKKRRGKARCIREENP